MAEQFYETLALAAFALLGLWWVVVAERRREWSVLPYRRRQAFSVSLYFTMTGVMSLVSLISKDHPALWRLAFGIAGGIGAVEVVLSLLRARDEPARARVGDQLLALTLPFYLLIVAIAIRPTLAPDIGIDLKPLETEAVVVSVLLVLGIDYGWLSSWSRHTRATSPRQLVARGGGGRAGARGKGRAVSSTALAGCGRGRDGRGCGERRIGDGTVTGVHRIRVRRRTSSQRRREVRPSSRLLPHFPSPDPLPWRETLAMRE